MRKFQSSWMASFSSTSFRLPVIANFVYLIFIRFSKPFYLSFWIVGLKSYLAMYYTSAAVQITHFSNVNSGNNCDSIIKSSQANWIFLRLCISIIIRMRNSYCAQAENNQLPHSHINHNNIPFGQYSVKISTVGRGKSIHAPTNRTVFSWLTSRACFISHNSVDVISTCKIKVIWELLEYRIVNCQKNDVRVAA